MPKESTSNVYMKIHAPSGLNGKNHIEEFDPPIKMTYREMQKFLKADTLQWVKSTRPNRQLVMDENGLYTRKPDNQLATSFVHPSIMVDGYVRGNCLMISSK
jgi:hypothetical protein